MDFLALDFETANEYRGSVCAIGLVVISDGQIANRHSWLVRPKDLYFKPYNTMIHGITVDDVQGAPEFSDLWDELRAILNGRMVIAHNASFDMSVLRYVTADYNLPQAEFAYSCTRLIGRKAWPGLISYSLSTVAESLGITFKHHDALEDARAAAEIAIRACEKAAAKSIEELSERLQFKNGKMYAGGYTPARGPSRSSNVKASKVRPSENAHPDAPLAGRVFAFTLTLQSMSRQTAMQRVVDAGGLCCGSTTSYTNFLVMGDQDFNRLRDGKRTGSQLKAEQLIAKGADLEMIGEDDFLRMLPG